MKGKRIEIEEADNGFSIRVWNYDESEDNKDDYGYTEPKVLVATTIDDVLKCVKENFK